MRHCCGARTGDSSGFADLLSRAIAFDPANKSAATLAATYYAENVGDTVGQFKLNVALMYADPMDPNVRFTLARQLASEGAVVQSARFHRAGLNLLTLAGGLEPVHDVERMSLVWQVHGPQQVVKEIRLRLQEARARAQRQYEIDLESDIPDSELVRPEQVHLDPIYEQMRVLAGLASLDYDAVDEGIAEIHAVFLERSARFASRFQEEETPETQQLQQATYASLALLNVMRAISNSEIDKLERDVTQYQVNDPVWQEYAYTLRAWLALRKGNPEAVLRSIPEGIDGDPYAFILTGLANEELGRWDAALDAYSRLLRFAPMSPSASWARSRQSELLDTRDPLTDAGREMGPNRAISARVD